MDDELSDSDSYDLPDIFEDNLAKSKELKQVRPGDIVWAEFRQLHWPALVRSVHLKDKKVSVWYLDSPGMSFKVPWKKIKSFDDKSINEMVRKQASQSPFREKHEKVLLSTLSFIRRQACGYEDNPRKFFDSNVPYLSLKNLESSSSSDKGFQTISCDQYSTTQMKSFKDSDGEISDDECDESSMLASLPNVSDNSDTDTYDKDTEKKIVLYIKAGRTDEHLLAVQSGKTPSDFHSIYEESVHSNRNKLWNINPCKLVRNLDKLREICCYLMDLFEKCVEGGKCVMHRYITAVWLPEAIDKAVSFLKEEESKSSNGVSCVKRNLMICKGNSFGKKSSYSKKDYKEKSKKKVEEKAQTIKAKKNSKKSKKTEER